MTGNLNVVWVHELQKMGMRLFKLQNTLVKKDFPETRPDINVIDDCVAI